MIISLLFSHLLKNLKKAKDSNDLLAVDTALEKLNKAWQAASNEMQQAQQQQSQQTTDNSQKSSSKESDADDVTDVDFEEVKDDK